MSTRRPHPPDDAPRPPKKARRPRRQVLGLLGVGMDGQDGHARVTKGEDFLLVGGSADTHERMQDFTIRLTEVLAKKGKRIRDTSPGELRDLASDLD